MGNYYTFSRDSEACSGGALRPITAQRRDRRAAIGAVLVCQKIVLHSRPLPPKNVLDGGRKKPQIHHKPNGTFSQRKHRPRSECLRRMTSIQRRCLLENSKAMNRSTSMITTKIEAKNKKVQNEKALLAACARGNLNKVEKLVNSGVDVNSSDQNQMSALHYAAMHTREHVIKFLISRGAEVNTSDLKGGFSALHWVITNATLKYSSNNHLDGCLVALTEAGCRVNATDFNSATPLHIAAQKGNKDGIKMLLRLRADPNKVDIFGRDCFEVAKNEQIETYMKELINMFSKKVHQLKTRHTYYVLEAPPPSFPAPLPPVLPSRLSYTRKTNQEEHFYHTPEHHFTPPSSHGPGQTSITPPPPPCKHCQYKQHTMDSHLYHVLEPILTRKSRASNLHRRNAKKN